MSSFLCFICHSTVNADTNEETREKYREVVGMNLCPDSHLCHICCHVLNRLWLFRSVCLKRSLEYPVLFSEKGTLNLQRNDMEYHSVCVEDSCDHYKSHNINCKFFQYRHLDKHLELSNKENESNDYCELYEDREFDDFLPKLNQHIENIIPHIEYENRTRNYCNEQIINTNHDEQFTTPRNYNDNHQRNRNYNDDHQCNRNYNDDHQHTARNYNNELNKDKSFNKDQQNTVRNFNDNFNTDRSFTNDQINVARNNNDDDQNTASNFNVEHNTNDDEENELSLDNEENNDEQSSYDDLNDEIHDLDNLKEEGDDSLKYNNEVVEKSEGEVTEKKKKSKRIKNKFKKILLSIEEQKSELEANRRSKKYIEAEFKCSSCGLGFLFKDTYQTHMMRHEESNGEHRCNICTLRFASLAVLRAHRGLHGERYRCRNCHVLVRKRQRTAHAKDCYGIETDEAACHLCGRVFKNGAGLQQHLKRFHNTTPARGSVCNVCGQRCANHAALRTHMIKHIQKKFPCDLCPSTLSSPYTLQQHMMSKHSSTPAACDVCGLKLTSEKGLKAHAKRMHSGERPPRRRPEQPKARGPRPARPAVCHLCGAVFKGNSKLNRHLREVCEKGRLEEELASYYTPDVGV